MTYLPPDVNTEEEAARQPQSDSQSAAKNTNGAPLSELALKGIGWQSGSAFLQIGLSLLVGVILARSLTPEDFGVVGYVMIFVGFTSKIAEVGIGPALVQKQEVTGKDLGAGLVLTLCIGFFACVAMWLLAPLIMQGTGVPVLRVLSLTFLISSPAVLSEALLQRKLNFSSLFLADMISYTLGYGLVSVVLALSGYGLWSLVAGMLAQSILRSALLLGLSPYRPHLRFRRSDLVGLSRFGTGMTLARLANFGAGNADYYVVGHFLGAQALGLYQRAFQLITVPVLRLAGVLTSVLFPAFSKIQGDMDQMKRMYLLSVSITSLVVVPIVIFLSLTSSEIILVLYGSQWSAAAAPLSILSYNVLFIAILTLGDSFARAKGLVYQQFRRHFTYAVMVFLFAFVGQRYSVAGVAVGVTVASFVTYLLMADLTLKTVKASWRTFAKMQLPGWLVGAIVGVAVIVIGRIAQQWGASSLFLLVLKSLAAVLAVVLVILFVPRTWLGDAPVLLFAYLTRKNSRIFVNLAKLWNWRQA